MGHWLTVTSNGSGEYGGGSGEHGAKQPPLNHPSHKREKSTDGLLGEESVINKSNHIDVDFQDGPTKFYCKVRFTGNNITYFSTVIRVL